MSLEDNVMLSDEEQVKLAANHLLQVYCDNTNEEGNTNLTGLTHMEGIMDSISYEYRAPVFSSFLDLLKMNEIKYDHKVFHSSPSKAVH